MKFHATRPRPKKFKGRIGLKKAPETRKGASAPPLVKWDLKTIPQGDAKRPKEAPKILGPRGIKGIPDGTFPPHIELAWPGTPTLASHDGQTDTRIRLRTRYKNPFANTARWRTAYPDQGLIVRSKMPKSQPTRSRKRDDWQRLQRSFR